MCERVALIVLTEDKMSERVSLLATSEGPLHFYGAPGLSSHGDARAGWRILGGAELEWTGETHESLSVRYKNPAMAKTIRQMVMDRYPTRAALITTILETRGQGGTVMWYPRTKEEFAAIIAQGPRPNVGLANLEAEIVIAQNLEIGDLDVSGYGFALPAGLTTTGDLDVSGYGFALPAGLTTTGDLYGLSGYGFALPAGLTTREL